MSRATFVWMYGVTKNHLHWIVLLVVLQSVMSLTGVGHAWLMRLLVDQAVARHFNGLFNAACLLALLIAVTIALRAFLHYEQTKTSSIMENAFQQKLFQALIQKEYASVSRFHSGEWQHRLSGEVRIVSNGVCAIIPGFIGMMVRFVGATATIVYMVPQTAWVIFPFAILLPVLTMLYRQRMKDRYQAIYESVKRLRIYMLDHLSSLVVVHTFSKEKEAIDGASQKMSENQDKRLRLARVSNFAQSIQSFFLDGATLSAAIYCGYRIYTGNLSYGSMMAIMQLVGQIQSPISGVSGIMGQIVEIQTSAERLMEPECFPEDIVGEKYSERDALRLYHEALDELVMENISFEYPETNDNQEYKKIKKGFYRPGVLSNFNLRLRRGEYLALTGSSGCGKSTVLKLLMALYQPNKGKQYLRLNARNGDAVLPLDSKFRNLFAYVPQGNHLLSGTLREVVAFHDNQRMQDEAALYKALEIACATDFVRELPEGLDTHLGERGSGLSEGQIQRIALARAIFSEHPVVLLDEATSALDEDTEAALLTNLRAMTDKTVIIVTHRKSALAICDRQLHIGGGIGEAS